MRERCKSLHKARRVRCLSTSSSTIVRFCFARHRHLSSRYSSTVRCVCVCVCEICSSLLPDCCFSSARAFLVYHGFIRFINFFVSTKEIPAASVMTFFSLPSEKNEKKKKPVVMIFFFFFSIGKKRRPIQYASCRRREKGVFFVLVTG